jgi:hypothetical protein
MVDDFRIRSSYRKLFRPLVWCVELNFVFVYLVYMRVYKVGVCTFGDVNNRNVFFVTCVKCVCLLSR